MGLVDVAQEEVVSSFGWGGGVLPAVFLISRHGVECSRQYQSRKGPKFWWRCGVDGPIICPVKSMDSTEIVKLVESYKFNHYIGY